MPLCCLSVEGMGEGRRGNSFQRFCFSAGPTDFPTDPKHVRPSSIDFKSV